MPSPLPATGMSHANAAHRLPHALHGNMVCLYITVQMSLALHIEAAQQDPGNPQSLTFCGAHVSGRSASSVSPFHGLSRMAPTLRASPQPSGHPAAFSCSCTELSLAQSCHRRSVCRSCNTGSQDSLVHVDFHPAGLSDQFVSCMQHLSCVC